MSACTRSSFGGDKIGAPCSDCRHTNLLHPGPGNPDLAECMLCVLAAKIDRVRDANRVVVQPGYQARILPTHDIRDDGSIVAVIELRRTH